MLLCLLSYHKADLTNSDVNMGNLDVSWQKSFHEENVLSPNEGRNVMALSAFLLSSCPGHVDRKALVKEMWESGAEIMVE